MMMFFFAHRNHASMRHFADLMLKLDGCMVDAKILVQALFQITQYPLAR